MLKEIIVGSLAGLAFGFFIGAIKYFLIWRPIIKGAGMASTKVSNYVIRFSIRFFLSLIFDLLALFTVYFCRGFLPWDYIYVLVGTAIALSISGLLLNKAISALEARPVKK